MCTLYVTCSGMAVICQLHEEGWRLPVSYMRLPAGLCVLCQLLETGWWLSRGVYYVSYLRQVLLLSAGCMYSVFYLRQVSGCLLGCNPSITCGNLGVIEGCLQRVCNLSVT